MQYSHLSRWFYFLCAISGQYRVDLGKSKKDFSINLVLMSSLIEGKGFGFGRGGGYKGGSSRGSGLFGGGYRGGSSRGSGLFGGSSSYNRGTGYGGYMNKP